MSSADLLEVYGDHFSRLSDDDVRALVVRLCEAELRRAGLPTSAITAGGDQDAPDGGIDVRIRLSTASATLDFIPKANTGFQVKASTMPPAEIKAEMRPKGDLRVSIKELGVAKGAYVIISSQDSTTDAVLQNRLKAMKAALTDLPLGSAVHVDFYDRDRLAIWVRTYPGVALWVREKIGEPMSGWRPYGNWAPGDSPGSEFLLDEIGRIYSRNTENPMTVVDGIDAIRAILAKPGGVVRLIGLSGLGKTRFVQALFDNRVGTDALDTSIVAYTDQGAEPDPSARDMIHRLRVAERRAIVVADNCNPATHRALAEMVKESGSLVSLITVEYDVADDEPEDTEVFRLAPASDGVLIGILDRLAPQTSQANRLRIVDFAGGNARIALALSKTIREGESLGILNDNELFRRLFYQNQQPDAALMRAAEACSLVYSFDGVSEDAELPILAGLAGLSVEEVFRAIADLRRRDLVQRRGVWRAMLPHAIANRLARQALERISTKSLMETFCAQGRERLLKSFARRLGYLHNCEPATEIARCWYTDTAWLADAMSLNELGMALFENAAPLCPEFALQAIERAANGESAGQFLSAESPRRSKWVSLLRALSYEPQLFDRTAFLLARLCAESKEESRDHSCSNFKELFHLYLSGTHALVDQRIALVKKLIAEQQSNIQQCGLAALNAMLESGHFTSGHDFSFGSRVRDFGWQPNTFEQINEWYGKVIGLVAELSNNSSPHRQTMKTLVARHFRSLWTYGGVNEELAKLAVELAKNGGWADGWIAVRMAMKYDGDKLPTETVGKLCELELFLRPQDLLQKLDAYVLSGTHGHFEFADADTDDDSGADVMAAWQRADSAAEDLGRQFVLKPDVLAEVLPRLLRPAPGRQIAFGRGMALCAKDLAVVWSDVCAVFASLPPTQRHVGLMQGYIIGATKRDRDAANALLEGALGSPDLQKVFPMIQGALEVDESAAARLSRSIAKGVAHASTYNHLSFGRAAESVAPATFKRLALEVAQLPNGFPVAIDLLGMRIHILRSEKSPIDEQTLCLGRELLPLCSYNDRNANLDYHIGEIARACVKGPESAGAAKELCESFVRALSDDGTQAWQYQHLANTLFEIQPEIALDAFFAGSDNDGSPLVRMLVLNETDGPVNRVPQELLLAWAGKDLAIRFPWVAGEIRLTDKGADGKLSWTPIAVHLLENATDRTAVLRAFSQRIEPRSWSGSLADVLTPYLQPIRALLTHSDPMVREWALKREQRLNARIAEERRQEQQIDARFE